MNLLGDENVHGDVVRGLRERLPGLDLVTVQEVGLAGTPDPELLAWAATEERILLTYDRATIPGFAYDRVRAGLPMPGVVVLDQQLSIGRQIAEMELFTQCSEGPEWRDQVIFLPT